MHGDHIFGLPGLISSRSFQGGMEPLEIYGPVGIKQFVLNALKISQTRLAYSLKFIEVTPGIVFSDSQFTVTCELLDHGIESYGYRVVEHDHDGELQVAKLLELGIKPGPIFGQLKKGKTVTLATGEVIKGSDYVGQAKKGRIVTILGDTRITNASVKLAQDADVLVHESTFNKTEAKMARNYYHSTTHQAAEVAKASRAKRLILTHISARYLAQDALNLEKEAQEIFPNTKIAKDFDIIEIPFQNELKD